MADLEVTPPDMQPGVSFTAKNPAESGRWYSLGKIFYDDINDPKQLMLLKIMKTLANYSMIRLKRIEQQMLNSAEIDVNRRCKRTGIRLQGNVKNGLQARQWNLDSKVLDRPDVKQQCLREIRNIKKENMFIGEAISTGVKDESAMDEKDGEKERPPKKGATYIERMERLLFSSVE
ncbi:MAG TPA: hypothetical protein EYQ50_11580 [Verrucomicrobiales bacterium]|nr:hypothetical protein [Verrucomicrobiales bacterium]